MTPYGISRVTQRHLTVTLPASHVSTQRRLTCEPLRHLTVTLPASRREPTREMPSKGRYSGECFRGDVNLLGLILQVSYSAKTAASCAAKRRGEVCAGLIVLEAEAKTVRSTYEN